MPDLPPDPPSHLSAAQAFRWATSALRRAHLHYGHGTRGPSDEAAVLLACALGCAPVDLDPQSARLLRAGEWRRLRRLISRRIDERLPAAYLVKQAWIGAHRFYIDSRCIVPRSHIAEVLDNTLDAFLPRRVQRILDLCTGSGCLAILTALAFPQAVVDASDLSRAALTVAKRNVSEYRLTDRIRLHHSDLFNSLGAQRYDLILCNPPYVTRTSMGKLPPEYRREPKMSLAGGIDGLDFVRRVLREAAQHMTKSAVLVCEIGSRQSALERAFPSTPFIWPVGDAAENRVFVLHRRDLL